MRTWLTAFLFFVVVSGNEDDEATFRTLSAFNEDFIQSMIDESSEAALEDRDDAIRIKIGILAVYFRVYKQLVPWSIDNKGFEHIYPEPTEDFDGELGKKCLSGLTICVDEILKMVNSTQPWLLQNPTRLDPAKLALNINNDLFSFGITASQILCYMTNSHVPLFENIPYCHFGMISDRQSAVSLVSKNWNGKQFFESSIVDEFVGKPYECAFESFCPNPCCSGLDDVVITSARFRPFCRLNTCKVQNNCLVKLFENDSLQNLRLNKFNITCGCEESAKIYRSDIGRCVNHNPCNKRNLCRDNFQECVNIKSGDGYKCVCQLGYAKMENGECIGINGSSSAYNGFAMSESVLSDAVVVTNGLLTIPIIAIIYDWL